MLLNSFVNDNIAHIAVQLHHNDRLCCSIDYINCTAVDGWKKYRVKIAVATELVQKWGYSGTVCWAVER